MAICLTYNIPFDGNYNYGMDVPLSLIPRLQKLKELFPLCIHTGRTDLKYDFTGCEDNDLHMSAKTTKEKGKVAPQIIGQPQPKRFCEIIGISYTNNADLKKYIQENITTILPILIDHTFHCPMIYYNKYDNTLRFIELISPIIWNNMNYTWTKNYNEWKGSSSLKILKPDGSSIAILEVQFHEKSRTNMANRWYFENFIEIFKDHLSIKNL